MGIRMRRRAAFLCSAFTSWSRIYLLRRANLSGFSCRCESESHHSARRAQLLYQVRFVILFAEIALRLMHSSKISLALTCYVTAATLSRSVLARSLRSGLFVTSPWSYIPRRSLWAYVVSVAILLRSSHRIMSARIVIYRRASERARTDIMRLIKLTSNTPRCWWVVTVFKLWARVMSQRSTSALY